MIVTPSARRWTSIRHRLRATAADSPSAMSARPRPSSRARPAAARAFGTLCAPCSRRVTGAEPSGVRRVKLGRPRSSRRMSAARIVGDPEPEYTELEYPGELLGYPGELLEYPGQLKVTTRAAVREAMARTRGSSAFRMATPSAGRAS